MEKDQIEAPQTSAERARYMLVAIGRLWQVWIATGILMYVVWTVAPQQVNISIYKASLITSGALIGYWVDRWTWPRWPADNLGEVHRMYRRVALMAAGMLAFGLGA